MISLPSEHNDVTRVSALQRYLYIDYSNSPEFNSITELAADICNTPISLVAFVDSDDIKLRFCYGLEEDSSIPRENAFCHYTIQQDDLLIVEDASQDERFKECAIVKEKPKFQFYAGMRLTTEDGFALGSLCVLDTKPNSLNDFQIKSLRQLATVISRSLQSKIIELEKKNQDTRYQSIINNAPICIHEIDINGNFSRMNPAGLDIMELSTEEEVKGIPYLSVVANKDHERIKNLLENALCGEMSKFEFTGASGNIFSSCFAPIMDANNNVIKLMGLTEDITTRKKNEKLINEENERLALVMRATNDCVWDLDFTTDTVWWNETYTNKFGRPPDENTWDWWLDRIHPQERARVRDSLASVKNSDLEKWDEEYRFQTPDGKYVYVQDRAFIARDQSGTATRVLGAMRDMTKEKVAEQEIREQHIALSHSLPGIARLNPDGYYTHVNEIYAGLLGYTPDELIGQSWKVTVDDSDIETGVHGYKRMLEEDNVEFNIKGIKKDKSPIFKHVLISKRVDDNGEFLGHLCFMKDITDQTEKEEQHKLLQHELAHVSRLSTVSELATGLAHELNQPLSAISHYIDAAYSLLHANNCDIEKWLKILDSTSEQVTRTGDIIRRSREFASKNPIEKSPVNIDQLAIETVNFLNADAKAHKTIVEYSTEKDLPEIQANKVQIQQVLVNLMRNGFEAMESNNGKARKLELHIIKNGIESGIPEIQVTVKDSGSGFKTNRIDKLFQPFYTSKNKGMGMGLAISRSIIEAHGGKLWAESLPDVETNFHFTLPLTE